MILNEVGGDIALMSKLKNKKTENLNFTTAQACPWRRDRGQRRDR
jgi:hypothetical protein